MNLSAIEMKAFVPASNFDTSKKFYLALGFEIPWSSEGLAYVRHENTSFLLQDYNRPDFIQHYMMHLLVESADDWYAHVMATGVVETFGVAVGAPQNQPWGLRDFTLFDTSGVLWRIGQNVSVDSG